MSPVVQVQTAAQLVEATGREGAEVAVVGRIEGAPSVTLAPGVRLRGGTLVFGAKGLRLSRDNTVEDMRILTAPHEAAVLNRTDIADCGTLKLARVATVGQVVILAEGDLRSGHLEVDGLDVERADVRGRLSRPSGYGVEAMQGGFTLWNRQRDATSLMTARLHDIGAGRHDTPVRGSGVFVAGTPDGGSVEVSVLRTRHVYTDGGIAPGTPDLISGGVFVVSGASAGQVVNEGPVTTLGQNDMVLDNWGRVDEWVALQPVTSFGPSGIGFVNFGSIETLDLRTQVTTHGAGARGFNLYDGHLARASFDGIVTTGDGAVGIQVARPMGPIEIRCDLVTSGGHGMSLVKGVQTRLAATALSVQGDGDVERVTVGGRVETRGDAVTAVEVQGRIGAIDVQGGVHALGVGAQPIEATGAVGGLEALQAQATAGMPADDIEA